MTQPLTVPNVDVETLREAIRDEYAEVAENPEKGFHFHTGRPLAKKLGYSDDLIAAVPERLCRTRRRKTSIYGPVESPELCWKRS